MKKMLIWLLVLSMLTLPACAKQDRLEQDITSSSKSSSVESSHSVAENVTTSQQSPATPEINQHSQAEKSSTTQIEQPQTPTANATEVPAESVIEVKPEPEPEKTQQPQQKQQPQDDSGNLLAQKQPQSQSSQQAGTDKLSADAIETELLRLINEERAVVMVEQLGLEQSIRWAARIRSLEIMDNFLHTRPNNTPYYTAFGEADFSYAGKWHGENISRLNFTNGMYTELQIAQRMYKSLSESPGHYQNMVSANFLQAGIGVSIRTDDVNTVVGSAQLFCSK